MHAVQQSSVRNRLLKAASPDDFALLQPNLELVPAPLKDVLIEPRKAISHLYFPEQGFTSITIDTGGGPIEVGMVGREGLVGALPVLLGVDTTPHRAFIQIRGENLRIPTAELQGANDRSSSLRALLLRYVQTFVLQVAQTAFANTAFVIEVRLARWLLMCHDRCDEDDIPMTHDLIASMLGVHRPGVTLATQVLEGKGLIKATRGNIRIIDRAGMLALANASYGTPEAEYASLIEGR